MKSVENVLKYLVPDAKFYGSLVGNNEAAYNAIQWADERAKPTWSDIEAAAPDYESEKNKADSVSFVKSCAGQVILSIAPAWKQRNMTARAVEIADAKAQGVATEQDLADAAQIAAVWSRIKAVRAKSDELEAQYSSVGNELTIEDKEAIKAALEAAGE